MKKHFLKNYTNKLFFIALLFCSFQSNLFAQGFPACPSITPVATPPVICVGDCTDLSATVVSSNQSTSYTVGSIPYVPYANSGGTSVSVGTDDIWSGVINLGFTFCYFGNSYNQAIIGSNGNVSFNLTNASAFNGWGITTTIPSTADMPGNTICAPFRDTDPSISGTVGFYKTGTAPCRALVIYWNNVALFSCSTPASTFQLVLYETTNFIDMYIQNSSGTCAWNGGKGIIGIQNATATVAVVPPGRNAVAFTAINEAWRFTPSGTAAYTVTWSDANGPIGTGLGLIHICPTTTTTYTASMIVTNCNALTTTFTNTVTVTVNPLPTLTIIPDTTILLGMSVPITTTGASTYTWTPPSDLSCANCASPSASPTSSTEYCVVAADTNGCKDTACVTITVENPCQNTKILGVPNAFSPNEDGVNDSFCLLGWEECLIDFKVTIFDRWGEKVYESTDPNFCWNGKYNGKTMDAQVLVYNIKGVFYNLQSVVHRKGNISLIR